MNKQRWCNIAYICLGYSRSVAIKMQHTLIITTALVLFSTLAVASNVPPPTNVTLQCHNFRNILYWNYSQTSLESQQAKFRINISQKEGFPEPLWVKPPYLSCDISLLCHTSRCYSSEEFLVSVTAVVGETESDSMPEDGLAFSYFDGAIDGIICKLDLPAVNVTVPKVGFINFSFSHPSKVYNKEEDPVKKRRKKKHQDSQNLFRYTVQTKGQEKDKAPEFDCDGEVCTGIVEVYGSPESHCVEINGKWDGIAVDATQEYCAHMGPPTDTTNQLLASILCPVAVLCIAVIGWMVFRKLTDGSSRIPDSMDFSKFSGIPRQETVERQMVESPTTSTLPLLSHIHDVVSISSEPEVHIGMPLQDKGVSSVLEDGQSEMGQESCYDSGRVLDEEEGYNSGRALDEEEVDKEGGSGCPDGYESRSPCENGQGEREMGQESCYDSGKVLDEEAGYNSGRTLDEEEVDNEGGSGCPDGYESRSPCESRSACESQSAYEPRDRLTVELSPGEEVDAYRG